MAELIRCHDCNIPVSFSARSCPGCGSREPAGPYRFSAKEARLHRIEHRNDNTLVTVTIVSGVIGAVFGVLTSSGTFGAWFGGFGYGLLGVLVGPPLAFVANMVRRWI